MTKEQIEQRKQEIIKKYAELKAQADRLEARERYSKYVEYTHAYDKEFKLAKFQSYTCDCIDKLLDGKLLNKYGEPYEGIVLSQPAQTGKSRCVTETLPSYFLGKNPFKHVIEGSYNEDYAEKFGRRNIEKINEFGKDLFGIEVSKSKAASTEFELDKTKGGMLSKGLGGGINGVPGDLIILDDPYKNRQDADSPIYKAFVISEWMNVFRTRASAKCKFIIVHTRWNEDDLIGYLLQNEPDKWFEIKFAMEAEEDDFEIVGRKAGEALLPESGKDTSWMKKFKTSFINDPTGGGLRAWNSLMQQRPTSKEGNMIKREYWKRYTLTLAMQRGEGLDEMLQSWDCTFKDTDGSDHVAGGVLGRTGASCFLMDLKYERLGIVKTMEAITDMTIKWPQALTKLIEDKANGSAVIEMMQTKIPGMLAIKPVKGKGERVNAVLPLWEAGNVYLPDRIEVKPGIYETCKWANQVIEQCASFQPAKKVQKDDIVDMLSQALNRLMYSMTFLQKELPTGYYTESELHDMVQSGKMTKFEMKQYLKTGVKPWGNQAM